ncbi:hypothetical protein [Undibacterium griseum]|uniref:Uncharacterized protein n=1 Tax=Undibacterium griseum TaxID=2762295 RepID=A0ABR6YNS4_9BURK|nr:hypothetical protein [Undibacterium griseum]MBC3885543.1 hypothetical protein [Undibacterium griseum]
MWVLALEAGIALGILIFIVWWTMFSGRTENTKTPQPQDAEHQDTDSSRHR